MIGLAALLGAFVGGGVDQCLSLPQRPGFTPSRVEIAGTRDQTSVSLINRPYFRADRLAGRGRRQPDNRRSARRWTPTVAQRAWKYMVIHHTASDAGDVASIDAAHRKRLDNFGNPWQGIGYHFVIGNGNGMPDGAIEATFRWTRQIQGAHAGVADYNELGIGICLVGNFEQHAPTAAQMASVRSLVRTLRTAYAIPRENVVGHSQVRRTACPGRMLSLGEARGRSLQSRVGQAASPTHYAAVAAETQEAP